MSSILKEFSCCCDGQIQLYYIKENYVEETLDGLKKAASKLEAFFGVPTRPVEVMVYLVPTRRWYEQLVVDVLKVNIEVPSRESRIAQMQRKELVLLSPDAYPSHSIYTYEKTEYERLLCHELTHVYHEHFTSNLEMTPRWLEEGLAIYLSNQWRTDVEFRDPVQRAIQTRELPSLEEVENSILLSYIWGWTLVRFLDVTYGQDLIKAIVVQGSDQAVYEATRLEKEVFEARWHAWLKAERAIQS
ncbi:hypothetical protein A374_07011 [Fictibacillus macauensis ZFHKF-1]|uniref:Peptidase MA-like domain-containing protein n=1 Tax=Fictibacillus macauensis ZFHKF-1 TaxID=1196324 RepID=I8UGN4_9BACL|nr:hypothetical protein [Fictibacillus macauensis]EIT86050.1 hypothetical protein A374_07011 [Fictibacillus macauensis ZFHKF-1]